MSSNLEGTPRERLAANLKTPYSADEKYWSALLDAFAAEIEELETVRAQVRAAKFVDTADAASLERLATRFELERKTDEPIVEFRARVKVALRSQLSSASLSEIREVITVLLAIDRDEVELSEPDTEPAYLEPRIPADTVAASDVRPSALNESLKTVTAAGVAVNASFLTDPAEIRITPRDVQHTELITGGLSSETLSTLSGDDGTRWKLSSNIDSGGGVFAAEDARITITPDPVATTTLSSAALSSSDLAALSEDTTDRWEL